MFIFSSSELTPPPRGDHPRILRGGGGRPPPSPEEARPSGPVLQGSAGIRPRKKAQRSGFSDGFAGSKPGNIYYITISQAH